MSLKSYRGIHKFNVYFSDGHWRCAIVSEPGTTTDVFAGHSPEAAFAAAWEWIERQEDAAQSDLIERAAAMLERRAALREEGAGSECRTAGDQLLASLEAKAYRDAAKMIREMGETKA